MEHQRNATITLTDSTSPNNHDIIDLIYVGVLRGWRGGEDGGIERNINKQNEHAPTGSLAAYVLTLGDPSLCNFELQNTLVV